MVCFEFGREKAKGNGYNIGEGLGYWSKDFLKMYLHVGSVLLLRGYCSAVTEAGK